MEQRSRRVGEPLRIWTVYERPEDYPHCYVARLWENDQPTDSIIISPTLEALREQLMQMHLVCLTRHPSDDAVIVETWL